MAVSILSSRRDYYEKCCWWKRDMFPDDDFENDGDNSELIFDTQPISVFYAKEYTPETFSNKSIGGVFLYDSATVTLKTPDDVDEIRQNDLVRYQNKLWMVDSVQKVQYRQKSNEFSSDMNASHFYYIKLRRY